MNRCRESRRVQSWLEGDLASGAAAAFEAHLASCAFCAAELKAYRRLFASLSDEILLAPDPGPPLTERILDRVLPSRLRRRWVNAIGWTYGTASAVSTFAFASWITQPSTHVWLIQCYTGASLRISQVLLFAFQTLTRSLLEGLDGWAILTTFGTMLVPLGRALARPLADPTVASILLAATLACAGMLRWMRSGSRSVEEEVRNVGLIV
jgi:anti-sigma factor RsiW